MVLDADWRSDANRAFLEVRGFARKPKRPLTASDTSVAIPIVGDC